jgi:signal transduction histidine kinase
MNLEIEAQDGSDEYNALALEMVKRMDRNFSPLDLVWDDIKWGKIHYSDPQVVTRLRWMPYLEIGFGIIFIAITLWGLQLIRRSEKNLIYAGMARETAHQLGTPVSSLMGWVKLLREENDDNSSILDSLEEDISRLSEISERFSKIGSKPKLKDISLYGLINEVSDYIKNRLPKQSDINISHSCESNIKIQGDWVLLRWAVENLMKNAVDAIGIGNGEILLSLSKNENTVRMDISDTGKGINRGDWKNIFRPGYSSKRRGWGLGLSLTQRIVEEIHGGNIQVLSSKPGKTVFRLNFNQ